jgi:transcriptional regulator with XRE-family HTH domain
MAINPILKIIRAKKLGILIRDAREKSGISLEKCAQVMGLSNEDLAAVEAGDRPPTLPELEILAFHLDVPLEHFWQSETLKSAVNMRRVDAEEIKGTRQRAIGDLIQQSRKAAGLTTEELSIQSGIAEESIQAYESGDTPIPLPELEAISHILNQSITDFEDHQGPVGSWFSDKKNVNEFLDLPQELKEFVSRPINRPYLELAVKLSELKVERLRALAEGLLEITL